MLKYEEIEISYSRALKPRRSGSLGLCSALRCPLWARCPDCSPLPSRTTLMGSRLSSRSPPTIGCSFAEVRCASFWHRSGAPRGTASGKSFGMEAIGLSRDHPFPCSAPSGSISRRGYRGMTSCVVAPVLAIVEALAQAPTRDKRRDPQRCLSPAFYPEPDTHRSRAERQKASSRKSQGLEHTDEKDPYMLGPCGPTQKSRGRGHKPGATTPSATL